jgi:signal transduction histidine kinase
MDTHRSVLEFSALSTVLLAHDLQNLLSIMAACVDALNGRAQSVAEERSLAELNHAVDSAFRLSRELLAAVGLQQAVEPPIIDVHELITRYQGTLRRLAGEKIRLVINTESSPAYVEAAPVYLEWILLNLIANARDAMPSGGIVYLGTTRIERWSGTREAPVRDARYLELTIRDEGDSGEEMNEQVFAPFFTTRTKAVGLGLTSIAATVRALKGWLSIETNEQVGRTVRVLLPLYFQKQDAGSSGAAI